MIQLRRAQERGHANHGWLDSYHTFSFADYHDPAHMGFSDLRVINDDRVDPGQGFSTHGHRDMEILTYVLDGELAHKDSMGNGSTITPGEWQYMSAGSGVLHSEFNPSDQAVVRLLQIWILPNEKDAAPRYDQKSFRDRLKKEKVVLIASNDGRDGSIAVRQNFLLYNGWLNKGDKSSISLTPERHGWLHVAKGSLKLGDVELEEGDAAALTQESDLPVQALQDGTEYIFFNLR
ncbi:MAG: pirin family protein [Bdellovibrionales bacterium]|nr:pirin family protein [Bdellovibrionales bacterium]